MLTQTLMLNKMAIGHSSLGILWSIEIHHLHKRQMADIVSGKPLAVY